MKRYVLLAVLLASQLFAQAPVPTGLLPELSVPAPQIRPVPFSGFSSVASRGDHFAVITARDSGAGGGTTQAVMHIGANGKPLLPTSLLVGICGNRPGIATDGSSVLAVWGCRGGTTGMLMPADGAKKTIEIHEQTRPQLSRNDHAGVRSVSWDGKQYVVLTTLETLRPSPELGIASRAIATLIDESGQIIHEEIDLDSAAAHDVASRDGLSVMLTSDAEGLGLRSLNAGGVVSAPGRITARPFGTPAIAAGADGFLVVWSEVDSIRAQRLDASGTPISAPLLLDSFAAHSLDVTAEGSAYRVAWSIGGQQIRAVRVDSGSVGTPTTVANGATPALAWNGAKTMLVWGAVDGTRARPIDEDRPGEYVHRLADLQTLVSIAMTPQGSALAWRSEGGHLLDSRAHRIVETGAIAHLRGLDRALIIEGSQPPFVVRYADAPDVSFEMPSRRLFWPGDGFLAVWSEPPSEADPFRPVPLFVQRFSASGTPLDASPRAVGWTFPLDASYSGPAAAYNGVAVGASSDEILLTYVDPWASVQGVIIRGDETIPIGTVATPYALARPIQITSDGKDFLVTWISNADTIHSYIGSRRVLAGGAMPEEMRVQTRAGDMKDRMATFWTGEHYLVVWSTRSSVGEPPTISGIRIARDGTLMDYPHRVIATIDGAAPQFAYRNGLLAIAYEREGRVWWRYAGTPRRRSVAR